MQLRFAYLLCTYCSLIKSNFEFSFFFNSIAVTTCALAAYNTNQQVSNQHLVCSELHLNDDYIIALYSGSIINTNKFQKTIEFNFNLQYPDGSSMNLVNEVMRSFKKAGAL